jgi:hypothetical protein
LWIRSLQLTIFFGYPFICMFFKVGDKFLFNFVREKSVCKGMFRMFFNWWSMWWSHLGVWIFNNWEKCSYQWVVMATRASVIALMKKNVVPFLMGVHYFAHWTKFIVLWKLTLVLWGFAWKPSLNFCMGFFSFA